MHENDVFDTRCFSYSLRGETHVADPFVLRRKLLEATAGRAWFAMQTYNRLKSEIADINGRLKVLEEDLKVNPPTPEENTPPVVGEGEPAPPPTRLQVQEYLVSQLSVHSLNFVRYEAGLSLAAYRAFNHAPFNPEDKTGVLESEILEVLVAFAEWAEKKEWRFGG